MIEGAAGRFRIARDRPHIAPGALVVDKPGKGMFYASDVGTTLEARAIARLDFAGVTTEVSVQTSMREASDLRRRLPPIEPAAAGGFPHCKAAA